MFEILAFSWGFEPVSARLHALSLRPQIRAPQITGPGDCGERVVRGPDLRVESGGVARPEEWGWG